MVKFLFSVHTITEAKQSNRQGGARAVDFPAGSYSIFFLCCHTVLDLTIVFAIQSKIR